MEMDRARRPLPPPPPAAAAAAAMSLVLSNDDLLGEIILRLGLPASLLRAALVCRRWYRQISDPAFLRRFHGHHPPRVLGIYLNTAGSPCPRFFPVRPLPELAAAARRAGSFFDTFAGSTTFIRDSRGSRLLANSVEDHYGHVYSRDLVCSPLSPAGDTVVVPPPPPPPSIQPGRPSLVYHYGEFLPGDGGEDWRSYFCALVGYGSRQTTVQLYEVQDMCWVTRAYAAAELPVTPLELKVMLFDDSKLYYILAAISKLLVCDFASSRISAMDLPYGVESDDTIMLSRGCGSEIFLIHVKESLLCVFHCKTDGDISGNWSLSVDNVCLRKVCANLGDESLHVCGRT